MENITVTFFKMCGLQETLRHGSVYFALTLVTYLIVTTVNLTLIITIVQDKRLHEPMYVLICNLSINALFGTAAFYPMILSQLLTDVNVISYFGCFSQAYVIHSFSMCEITILSVMACDRYLAICRPLHYHVLMSPLNVGRLVLFAWLYPLSVTLVTLGLTFRLPLCGSNIYNVFCDNPSIIRHSCVPISINRVWGNIVIILQALLVISIVISYCQIIRVCLNSAEGRMKFTQTCIPHLLAMGIFIMISLFDVLYVEVTIPLYVRNAIAAQFLVIPPLFNPLIYGLNIKMIRMVLFKKK